MNGVVLSMRYSGFDVVMSAQNNPSQIRNWKPGEGEYEKNLFCTYLYKGRLEEYKTETNELDNVFQAELCYTDSVSLDYPTYEVLPEDTVWLCFSSYKPYSAEFLRLNGSAILPAGVGAFCALGSFIGDGVTAKALNYLKPREYDVEIIGDAKVVLIKYGKFVNVPL